jgi:hypothetical protein
VEASGGHRDPASAKEVGRPDRRLARTGALLLVCALITSGAARADDTQDELWPEADAFLKLDSRFRLYLHAKLTYSPASWTPDGTSSFQEVEAGPGLDITIKPMLRHGLKKPIWERERYLWARVAYEYISTFGDVSDPSHENRGIIEVTGRIRAPAKLWLVNRGQVDFRDKNGTYSTRYRYRLTVERETVLFGAVTTPYVDAEVLYDTKYDAWNQQRYEVGLEIVLDDHWRLEPHYLRQNDQRAQPAHVNAFGLILKYYR